jgi:hypothetical protein
MRRKDASMLPITSGTSAKASRARCAYTITARSGRRPGAASGV